MGYKPHPKQVQAHLAFLTGGYKRGVLLWGRQCLHPDTLVATKTGHKRIADIKVGELVMSYGKDKWQQVTNKWEYGVDTDPKPMLYYQIDGQQIKSTYDHKFYYSGKYVEIYKLAWGAMAPSQRLQLKLLCEQYGAPFDDQQIWQTGLGSGDETSQGRQWVPTDNDGRAYSKSTQGSSSDLASEPREQSNSEPHRQQQSQQPDNKLGVGNPKGEYPTLSQTGQSCQQTGRKLRDTHIKRKTGARDTGFAGQEKQEGTIPDLRSCGLYDWGYTKTRQLVSHISVEPCEPTVAIEVGNNNYAITKSNILVSNSGKSYWSVNHAWLSAVIKQGRYFVVFKTYRQAHEVVWRQYVPLIPKELIYKKNEQDLLVELNYVQGPVKLPDGTLIEVEHDENKPRSTIQLLGSDQADLHRGFKADGMVFDEYADQNPDNWDAVYKHFFTTTDGWAAFIGTPRGYNHFWDLVNYAQEDDRWFYMEATWRDSPYVKKEFIEDERKEAEKRGTLSTFLQEVELEFRAVQGAVYPMFDRKIHILKPSDIPEDLTYYGAIDFGWHTTAFILFGVDKDQNWYAVDEVYGREETLDNIIPRIKDKVGDKRLVLIVGDSANRDAIEVMNRSFPIVGVNKANDTKGYQLGIGLIAEKLKPKVQLVGPPKPSLYYSSVCKNLTFETEAYKFPEEKAERNPSDVPVKENDHGPDATRYLFLHLKHGLTKDEKLPKSSVLQSLNEYGF